MMQINKSLLFGGALLFLALIGAGGLFYVLRLTPQKAPELSDIIIGYNANQSSGSTKEFGISGLHGFEIAVDEINAKGGILGRKIRTVVLDDKNNKELSKQNVEQLVFQDKAVAIIGPVNSPNALYWMNVAEENHVVAISHVATVSSFTREYAERPENYLFRVSMVDQEQTRMYVAWLLKKTKNGKIAIIRDNTKYGEGGAKDVAEVLARWGKVPVTIETFDPKSSPEDLVPMIRRIQRSGADGIVLFCYADAMANSLKAIREVKGYRPFTVGTWANLSSDLWKSAGPVASDLVFTASAVADANPESRALAEKIMLRYRATTPIFVAAAQGYDTVMLLRAAIEKAGSTEGPLVRQALEDLPPVSGVVKRYEKPFDHYTHDALSAKDFHLAHWVDGKVVSINEDLSNLEIR